MLAATAAHGVINKDKQICSSFFARDRLEWQKHVERLFNKILLLLLEYTEFVV
jgi:hypothetical protein